MDQECGKLSIMPDNRDQTLIRAASTADAERMAQLCQQLGYPASQEQVARRLDQIQREEGHAVYVAQRADGHVIGWVHVCRRHLVLAEPQAEIEGLVVDEGYRHGGVGRSLMEQTERWASAQGCAAVSLRSNVIRESAHAFYERIGYRHVKTQRAFRKCL
jgi:N-acetylglutamate synthase-like GNAT family acetyltransferase